MAIQNRPETLSIHVQIHRHGRNHKFTSHNQISSLTFSSLLFELLFEVLEHRRIKIFPAQMRIASGSLNSEDTTLDVQEGNIESSSTEIVDEDVAFLVRFAGAKTVGDGSSGRLVDDTEDVKAGDGASVFCRLPLVVVEVCGNGDDGL